MCCLFGLLDYSGYFNSREKNILLSVLASKCEVRGMDATGIAYNSSGLRIYKRPIPAHLMQIHLPPDVKAIMGHTRLTTQGSQKNNWNNHPFRGHTQEGSFALAHNGVLQNDISLRKELSLPQSAIETDSYIAVQLLEKENALNFASLKGMAEKLNGSFTFTILDGQDNLYIVKGDNPICIYHYADRGFYLYASTEEILKQAIGRLGMGTLRYSQLKITCGDILKIDRCGQVTTARFDTSHLYMGHRGYFTPYAYSFCDFNLYAHGEREEDYIELLKSVASGFGYTGEDVEQLLAEGFTPEEIENCFYEL